MSVPGQGVRPQVNKFEHVSNDDHQMSVAGVGYPGKYDILGGGVSYHVIYPMMHAMLPASPWTE